MQIYTIPVGVDNCYIIRDKETILIDGGMPGQFKKFVKGLEKLNISAEEISLIVVTHSHWDHIGCLQQIKELTAAKVAIHKNEINAVVSGEPQMPPAVTRWGKIFAAFLGLFTRNLVIEKTAVDIEIRDDDFSLTEYGIKGKIVFTPGHSLGSTSVILDSGDAFVGDMAMNGPPLTLKPNLPIFAEDLDLLIKSWQRLKDIGVKKIYPAHGKPFPFAKIEKKFS